MEQNPVVPTVETVAVIIRSDEGILVVFNEKWGIFTLPMTKLRRWQDPNIPVAHRDESPIDAAARAAAEWLGKTFVDGLVAKANLRGYRQSDRDGVWKEYRIQVFEFKLPHGWLPWAGVRCEWLTSGEILNAHRRPISPTAQHVIREVSKAP